MQCASIATDKSLAELSENIRQAEQRETIQLFRDQLFEGRIRNHTCVLGNIAPQCDTLVVEAMKVDHPRLG